MATLVHLAPSDLLSVHLALRYLIITKNGFVVVFYKYTLFR